MDTSVKIGLVTSVQGCVTQERQILGKTPEEMERLLGFEKGYLGNGAIIYALTKLPKNDQFALASYTNVPATKEGAIRENASRFTAQEIEVEERIMKHHPLENQKNMSRNQWSETGINRLVKVRPVNPPRPPSKFPPGEGVKQWVLLENIDAKVIAVLGYKEKHITGK